MLTDIHLYRPVKDVSKLVEAREECQICLCKFVNRSDKDLEVIKSNIEYILQLENEHNLENLRVELQEDELALIQTREESIGNILDASDSSIDSLERV